MLDLVNRLLDIMDSPLVPDVRNEASNEILHQYLSAEKARTLLHGPRSSHSMKGSSRRSTGIADSSLLTPILRVQLPPAHTFSRTAKGYSDAS